MKRDNLLSEIEQDLVSDTPVADTLRKCILLGGRTGSVQLREWAALELKGYAAIPPDQVPEYRNITAPLYIDGYENGYRFERMAVPPMWLQQYNSGVFDETFVFRQGVGEIETYLADAAPTRVQPQGGADLVHIINMDPERSRNQQVERIYWSISNKAVEGVTDGVKTALVELVSEIGAGLGPGQDLPDQEVVDHALSIAVKGFGHRITVAQAQTHEGDATVTVTQPQSTPPTFWTPARRLSAFAAGSASIVSLVGTWQGWFS